MFVFCLLETKPKEKHCLKKKDSFNLTRIFVSTKVYVKIHHDIMKYLRITTKIKDNSSTIVVIELQQTLSFFLALYIYVHIAENEA